MSKVIKKQQLRWKMEEFKSPLNKLRSANFGIVEDDANKFPVCLLACSTSDIQSDALLIKQRRYASMIAATPELLVALQKTNDIIGKLTDANLKKHYAKLCIQYDENLKAVEKALGIKTEL
ncbi:hypothetical protein M2138_000172 [Dysgonomonadaceae bacterium PH5-43]|nr:hypothetical protein [Dysgonomonadaceae bacterium PH5-43]